MMRAMFVVFVLALCAAAAHAQMMSFDFGGGYDPWRRR